MNKKNLSASELIALNQAFYDQVAHSFSQTREFFWAGWDNLLPILQTQLTNHNSSAYRILDLGCGNARWAIFLAQNLPASSAWQYFGIDNSTQLLQLAQEKIAQEIINNHDLPLHPQTTFSLDKIDLTQDKELNTYFSQSSPFNCFCLFGVLHHLPDYNSRLQFLTQLTHHLQNQGLLIFSLWQFMNDPRLAKKAQPLTDNGDYLLDWQRSNQNQSPTRFCHHFSNLEIEKIISTLTQNTTLKLINRYQADGPLNDLNTYLVFQKTK